MTIPATVRTPARDWRVAVAERWLNAQGIAGDFYTRWRRIGVRLQGGLAETEQAMCTSARHGRRASRQVRWYESWQKSPQGSSWRTTAIRADRSEFRGARFKEDKADQKVLPGTSQKLACDRYRFSAV